MTLNLTQDGPEGVSIRSCELLGPGFRSRISFSDFRAIEDVLVARLAQAIAINLRDLPTGAKVLALPDFLIELPGLVLSGAHFMVMELTNTVRNVIVRFNRVTGSINKALKIDVGFAPQVLPQNQALAVSVFSDICLPILNVCYEIETAMRENGGPYTPQLMEQAQEFRFQTELLKRFITNADNAETQLLGNSSPVAEH